MSQEQKPEEPGTAPEAVSEASKAPGRIKRLFVRLKDYIWSRQPRRPLVIVVGLCLAILMGLGTWQMVRLQQKNALLLEIKSKISAPLTDLSTNWPQSESTWAKLEYQPVQLKGQWLGLHSFKLIPRTYEGQVGYQWLVPLQLPDRQVVLVNRGFVPDGQAMLPPREGEEATIQGVGWIPPTKKPWQTPENIPSRGLWTWLDVEALKHEIGVQKMAPFVLYELRNPGSDDYPIGGQFPSPTHNRHAQYAMTWYMLASVLLFISFIAAGPREHSSGGNSEGKIADPVAERGMYPEATD